MLKRGLLLLIILLSLPSLANNSPKNVTQYEKYISPTLYEYYSVNNALNLTDCQTEERKNIILNNSKILNHYLKKLEKESYTLEAFKKANAPHLEIKQQKKWIKTLQKQIDKIIKLQDKCIRQTLNKNQRAKYSMIRKLEKKEIKNLYKVKNYRKTNPELRYFGNN